MEWDILIPVAVSIIGAGVSIYTARQQRRKLEAEADNIKAQGNSALVASSITLIDPLRKEIRELREELATERQARRADAARCEAEIQLRDTEIAILKRELNRLNRRMEAHDASIKKLKNDTDDLALQTPPPHHADPTPPIPPPPPSDDPADWE